MTSDDLPSTADVAIIGGGPAGLYFAILMKGRDRSHDITVVERDGPNDTFGWGIVFSETTLDNFGQHDRESYDEFRRVVQMSNSVVVHHRGEVIRIDHFGNVLTNIMPLRWLDDNTVEFAPPGQDAIAFDVAHTRISCGWHTVNGMHPSYSAVPVGQSIALIGSSLELEIAINQGNVSQAHAIKVGSPVTLQFK